MTKLILGILLILYSLFSLFNKNTPELKTESRIWLFICGFFSGILGGAYGLNGPPLVVYGNLRKWPAQYFRATLQAYFLPASVLAMVAYWFKGLWIWEVSFYFLISIPVISPAIFIGRYINKRMQHQNFLK